MHAPSSNVRPRIHAVVVILALALATANPAGATGTPTKATARAVDVPGLGVATRLSVATNDGTQPTREDFWTTDTGVFPGDWTLSVSGGVIGQGVRASADGSSAACAGLLATGSTLALAADGSCDPGPDAPGATVVVPGAVIAGGARVASCVSDSTGGAVGRTHLGGVTVSGPSGEDPVALPDDPAPGTVVRAHGYTIVLNAQQARDGRLDVVAMRVVSDAFAIRGDTGVVSCGIDVAISEVPIVPLGGRRAAVALALGGAAAAVGRSVVRRRLSATPVI